MRNLKKKGFTIVELVIVIAVIAVLAAVLIPTFVTLTNRANMSADQVAVKNMNTALATAEATKEIKTFNDVLEALADAGFDGKDYKPLTSDTYFYWDNKENRIVHADKTNKILYPLNLKNAEYATGKWWSLSGLVPEKAVPTVTAGKAEVSSAGELVALAEAFKNNSTSVAELTEVKLSGDIDLMGAAITFGVIEGHNFSIVADEEVKIYNFSSQENTIFTDRAHNTGIVGESKYGTTITFKNLNIVNAYVGSAEYKNASTGILVGQVQAGSTLIVENVTISDSEVYGYNKVGALVGRTRGSSVVNMTKVVVKNTKVYAKFEAAKVVGFASSSSDPYSADMQFITCDFAGIEVIGVLEESNYIKDGEISWDVDPNNSANTTYYLEDKIKVCHGITDALAWINVSRDTTSATVNGEKYQLKNPAYGLNTQTE